MPQEREDHRGEVVWQVVAPDGPLRREMQRYLERGGYRVVRLEVLPPDVALNSVRAAVVLSEGARAVLQAWLECATQKQVADKLHLSRDTVNDYTQELYKALDVNARHLAIVAAIRAGLLEIEPGR